MRLGLLGHPVSHSLSPKLFLALSRLLKRPIIYKSVDVKDGDFAAAAKRSRNKGWRGINITIPFKLQAANFATRLSTAARVIGAVNVLRFGRDTTGHNTDAEGLRDALTFAGVVMSGKHALVFGAGGAARAAGWALARGGARSVHFTNRTSSTAKECVRDLAPTFPRTSFSSGAPRNADIWINATPLGLQGYPDISPAPKALKAPAAAVDLVYGRKTAFQRHAEGMGSLVTDGTPMLVFQALRAYEFWDRPFSAPRRAALAEKLIKELL